MRFSFRLGAVVAAAGLVFAAADAGAATFTVTYSGIVANGYDNYGFFGAGQDLGDQAFVLKFTVDTGLPDSSQGDSGLYWDTWQGAAAGSPVSAAFTLNGKTVDFGSGRSYDQRWDERLNPDCVDCSQAGMELFATDLTSHEAAGGGWYKRQVSGMANAYDYNGLFNGLAHTAPGSFTEEDGAHFYGWFAMEEYTSGGKGLTNYAIDTSASLKISSMMISSLAVTSAPEPETWALMIMGFGLAGAALRRSRRASSVRQGG